ncbi:MAG: polyphosphate kinase 1 [Xanthomonadales bacterium]|nr:polyphosphate kinase 1 [Xanthomonadales bacterium]
MSQASASVTESELPTRFEPEDSWWYLNRELTWLEFNRRVLAEAKDERTPLLERVKFLAIVGSNLDEFFMKRIGGLKQQVGAGLAARTIDGRTPQEQIDECHHLVRELESEMHRIGRDLRGQLTDADVYVADYAELSDAQRKAMRSLYRERYFPLITPQAIDPAHPFPFISNLSLNLLVKVRRRRQGASSLVRVKVPVGPAMPRFIRVPDAGDTFVRIDEVVAANLDLLLPGMEIESCEEFRVTRNAITEKDEEEADDLLELIQSELRERKFAPIVRLEVEGGMRPGSRRMLARALGLDRHADVFEQNGPLAYRDWFEFVGLDRPKHRYPLHRPVVPAVFEQHDCIFDLIRANGSVLVHHPYESFKATVERFLLEASHDPQVRAIKMTLYRTSEDTGIIEALISAARNDKQVAVVVELKARFDESKNIRWANRLEEAGIHVTYGVVGLKTHCKVIYALRQEGDRVVRYAHVGTGNYHAGTAALYSDLGLFTCDERITADLNEIFNYLTTGFGRDRDYRVLLPSPQHLKQGLLCRIQREIDHVDAGRPGRIRMKMNALEDVDLTRALYEASRQGVKIDLIVRDTCRLRPGIPGISDNVTVVSIVGRFLEHIRIYHFHNDGKEEYFIGSADAMKRNLESRVEVVVPVMDRRLQMRVDELLKLQLEDRRQAWVMQPDGRYIQREPEDVARDVGCQQRLIDLHDRRATRRLGDPVTRLPNRNAE